MWRNKLFLGIMCLAIFLIAIPTANAEEVILGEDFEGGISAWTVDYGVWEICMPEEGDPGPQEAHGGYFCAATVCKENYPAYTDSQLISPEIQLPAVSGDEELHLRFWQWFSYSSYDYGYVQVQVQDGSPWEPVQSAIVISGTCAFWSLRDVELTAYAGEIVKIAFFHTADRNVHGHASESTGWYIDNVEVIKKVPAFTGDFETGWGDWTADNCVWEVGTPTSGPEAAHSGFQCAATVLDGNYPGYTDSHLISPSILLPDGEEPELTFWHWFSYSSYDYGYVQISVQDEATGEWSAWDDIAGPFEGVSSVWSQPPPIPLIPYAGEKVRIAFYHTANRNVHGHASESSGWYIDHIRITGSPHFCECDLNQDTVCDMQDWLLFGEDWGRTDCNELEVEPCECDLNHDGSCDMLDWLRFGEDWGQTDCLICE